MSKRKSYTAEFKREAASLVLDQNYFIPEACEAMGVGKTAMRRWITQLKEERLGRTPKGSRAITSEQQKIQALEAQIKKLKREKEILKKASALLISDAYQF